MPHTSATDDINTAKGANEFVVFAHFEDLFLLFLMLPLFTLLFANNAMHRKIISIR